MAKLIILDDVFDPATISAFTAFDYSEAERWYDMGVSPLHEKILEICRGYFDLDQIVGYEMWQNRSNPDRHIDKNETLYREQGKLELPQCSAVYYASVENMVGGEFYTDTMRCFPRTNRLLLFSPGIPHGVTPFVGTRFSISINPWTKKI
ncbi:MAG: 2OG-Fe(II) oxygenase [Enhydrobacter sp.]